MIETKHVYLRNFNETDLNDLYEYAHQEKVGPMAGWQPHANIEVSRQYLNTILDNPFCYAIVDKSNNKVIGSMEIKSLSEEFNKYNPKENSVEIGAVLNEDYWSKGYMTELIDEALNYCFTKLKAQEVFAANYSKNIGSTRIQEKNGFKKLGIIPNSYTWFDGSICDTILRKITKEEYYRRKEKLYFERPSIDRKADAIDYINEHIKYESRINGTGSLNKYVMDDNLTYEDWLEKVNKEWNMVPTEKLVPAETYFLVRESDNKIVGMINIRTMLNDILKESGGGHIGYGIRPTERGNGYNKINLYLGLKRLNELGVKEAMLGCLKTNLGSSRTMKALGAKLLRTGLWKGEEEEVYLIDVDKSLEDYKDTYEKFIAKEKMIKRK